MISLLPQRLRAAGSSHSPPGTETTGKVPEPAEWLRLARIARVLSWITLAWMGIEGG